MKEPLASAELSELAARGGVTVKELLNPKSTGFKELKLAPDQIDDAEAARLIYEYPKIMRRPLLSDGEKLAVGFDPNQFAALLK